MRHATLLELADEHGITAARRASRRLAAAAAAAPTSGAGSGSSGCTTWPGRCCAPRPTCAGWCSRPPRTSRRGLGLAGDPGRPAAATRPVRRAHRRSPSWCSTRPRTPRRATGVGIGVVIAANRTRHPLDARTLARLAAQYAGRGVVGFGLSNDERRGRTDDFAPAFRIAPAAGLLAGPARRRAARPGAACGPASTSCSADRLGHGVARRRGPGAARAAGRRGDHARGVPGVERGPRGLPATRPTVPLRTLLDAGRAGRARRRRPAAVRVPAGRAVRAGARASTGCRRRAWPGWRGCRCAARAPRTSVRTRLLAEHRRLAGGIRSGAGTPSRRPMRRGARQPTRSSG